MWLHRIFKVVNQCLKSLSQDLKEDLENFTKLNKKLIFRNKKQLNILSLKSITNNFKKYRPSYILHLAGLSRPMKIHEQNINKSIDLNIIGTCNLVKEPQKEILSLFIYLRVTSILAIREITVKKML